MITILSVQDPRATADEKFVDLDLDTKEFGLIPCTVAAHDPTSYVFEDKECSNADLFARAKAGEFGPIKAFVKGTL